MAGERRVTLVYSGQALRDLDAIWTWNAKHFTVQRVSRYVKFVQIQVEQLISRPLVGVPIESNPDFRFLLVQRKNRRDGHIVVYQFSPEESIVKVLHLFHTKQD